MASVKSFVWYSPVAFERAGYEVPTTWDELVDLTDRVVADHPDGSVAPWCLGASDGATTGWPVSDWLENGLLAIHGTGAYDQWANHDVPVDAPAAVSTYHRGVPAAGRRHRDRKSTRRTPVTHRSRMPSSA